jgi:hypothetical protein
MPLFSAASTPDYVPANPRRKAPRLILVATRKMTSSQILNISPLRRMAVLRDWGSAVPSAGAPTILSARKRRTTGGSRVRRSRFVIFLIARRQSQCAVKKYYREYYPRWSLERANPFAHIETWVTVHSGFEQWVTSPRFVISGAWGAALRKVREP